MPPKLNLLLDASREISWEKFGKRIRFCVPSFIDYENSYFCSSRTAFPSISITGNTCALQCKHCASKVLSTMIPAPTPQRLFEVCQRLSNTKSKGCLISGGCLSNGSLPFQRFLKTMKKIKEELGLKIIIHTGIISKEMAQNLRDAGVDAALIDVIGSDETIQEIVNSDLHIENYEASLKNLYDSGIAFVPHVIVGLHYGALRGELNALKMISKYSPSSLVVIALIPLKGTPLENCNPPTPESIAQILATAKIMLPSVPLSLGCMRPTGRHRIQTDILAVKAGVNAIAFPEKEAIELAKSLGLKVEFSYECCSQIYENI